MNTIDRNAVIEECAKVCDELDRNGYIYETYDGVEASPAEAGHCAAALRALKSQPAKPDPRDEALRLARDAIQDLRSGWIYIRETHGDLYGVGWDRAESKADEALAAIDEVMKGKQ